MQKQQQQKKKKKKETALEEDLLLGVSGNSQESTWKLIFQTHSSLVRTTIH